MSKTSKTEGVLSKSVLIFSFIILLFCNSAFSDETAKQPGEQRRPKQPRGFLEWLFGPPVTESNKNDRLDTSTNAPIIFHQVNRTKNNSFKDGLHHSNKQVSSQSQSVDSDPDHLRRSEVHLYQSPTSAGETFTTTSTLNPISFSLNSSVPENSENTKSTQRRILLPKPRPRNVRSPSNQSPSPPENNFRQIQITDIQHAIGTEINEDDLNSDPGQVNLQEELEAVDRFEKNLTDENNPDSMRRAKRATNSKFRQLNIPYGSASSNDRINTLSKRQLLISPAEQQMFAVQQQQHELAAASMLRQQQLLNPYGRYNNRYIDDYYDDDSSYEDSDEYYDHFNRNGLLPIVAAMRHGVRIPPIHHPYGIGRRSLPDEVDMGKKGVKPGGNGVNLQMTKQGKAGVVGNWGKSSRVRLEDSFLGPISKGGRWGTIEDYDLSSDFNKLTRRKGTMTSRDGVGNSVGERHKESEEDEEEEYVNGEKAVNLRQKGRSSLGWRLGKERQEEDGNITTSVIPDTPEITTPVPTTIPETSATEAESPTPEELTSPVPSEPEEHEETTTPIPSSSTVDPEEEATSSTTIRPTTSKPTSSKPRPTTVKPEPANLPPYHQTLNCRCGMQSVRGHDVGDGTIVRAMVNPWLVAVRAKGKHLCSGSIINNKYILTSKNCVHGVKGLVATAGLGSGIPKNFSVIRVNEHRTRNIALLKVKPAISPNFAMRPICLPIRYQQHANEERTNPGTGILVTFKRSSQKGNSGLQLVQTEVPMLSSSKCGYSAGDSPSGLGSICPGPPGTMKCGGDPGGVLQIYHKGYSYEQIGLVSTTVGCRANKTPGDYTDLRKSVKWVLYNTKDARYCRKPKVTPQDLMNAKKVEVDSDLEDEFEENEEEWRSDELEEEENSWARSHN